MVKNLMNHAYLNANSEVALSDRPLRETLIGLKSPQKEVRSKWLYDERGSQIFDQITLLDEYYPPRIEMDILRKNTLDIAAKIPLGSVLLELGSGSSIKTRLLLDTGRAGLYIPIDISQEHLLKTAADLEIAYPALQIHPIHADYFDEFPIPQWAADLPLTVFFPGTSLGNLFPDEQHQLLDNIAQMIGSEGGMILGVDMKKHPEVLHLAYNDPEGVTAEFNLNVLRHLNERFDANFQLENFTHYAPYNPIHGRMEMHLISKIDQEVTMGGEIFTLDCGESILTEVSYKFTKDQFATLAAQAGLQIEQHWTDAKHWFSIFYLKKIQE